MKRCLALLLVLALVSAGVLAFGTAKIIEPRAAVTFAETNALGDMRACDGLEVGFNMRCGYHHYWSSTLRFQNEAYVSHTDYDYYEAERSESVDEQPVYFDLYKGIGIGTNNMASEGEEPIPGYEAWGQLMNELMAGAPEGVAVTKTVRLADYFTWYPLVMLLTVPGHTYHGFPSDSSWKYMPIYREMLDYFRIRVLPDEQMTIRFTREGSGSHFESGEPGTEGEDAYSALAPLSAAAEDALYFCFISGRSDQGRTIDFSDVPGGFGLYRLSLIDEDDPNEPGAKVPGRLETVLPLPQEWEVRELWIDEERGELFLNAVDDDVLTLHIYDLNTFAEKQTLELFSLSGDKWTGCIHGSDCTLMNHALKEWQLLIEEDGVYHLLEIPISDADAKAAVERLYYESSGSETIAWDGERLVFAALMRAQGTGYGYPACGFHLAVFNGAGLKYFGSFPSSLTDQLTAGGERINWTQLPIPCTKDPLKLSFTGA